MKGEEQRQILQVEALSVKSAGAGVASIGCKASDSLEEEGSSQLFHCKVPKLFTKQA